MLNPICFNGTLPRSRNSGLWEFVEVLLVADVLWLGGILQKVNNLTQCPEHSRKVLLPMNFCLAGQGIDFEFSGIFPSPLVLPGLPLDARHNAGTIQSGCPYK